VCESKRDSEMFFSFSFLYCNSAVNRNGAAVLGEKTESSFANFLLFNRNTERERASDSKQRRCESFFESSSKLHCFL
jgi:hypothetical protein